LAQTEEGSQSFVDGGDLVRRQFAIDSPHPPLANGSQMIDQGE
jgi:hypothetical protein